MRREHVCFPRRAFARGRRNRWHRSVPGECARAFLDVVFGVVSHAQAEELHDFAGEVFVVSAFAVEVVVEVAIMAGSRMMPKRSVPKFPSAFFRNSWFCMNMW